MFSKFYFYHPVSVMWIASNNIFQEIIFVFFIHDISSTRPVSWQWESWTERKWLLFKRWKALSTQINHYPAEKRFIEIYPVDNIIQLLNNGGQIYICSVLCVWMLQISLQSGNLNAQDLTIPCSILRGPIHTFQFYTCEKNY